MKMLRKNCNKNERERERNNNFKLKIRVSIHNNINVMFVCYHTKMNFLALKADRKKMHKAKKLMLKWK